MITQLTERQTFQYVRKAQYVFSVALIYRISLTPRFSEVHGRLFYHTALAVFFFTDKKPLKRLWALSERVS